MLPIVLPTMRRLRARELKGYLRRVTRERLVGTNVAGYTMAALVGEGGTSTVYRAEHPQHGTAAVKVLREKLRQDKTAVERFLREARYGARVVHPNVVRTIEIGTAEASDGGAPLHFLAIEWASGDLLERYAKRNAPLPASEVAEIIVQIAGAVQAAHAAGIVHRDLKPENVMYDPESRRVKLLDFGIATDTDPATDERLTRAGFFVGTLMYVAPEALSGELVTPAADQYSLATIAYYLLTGALPYPAKSPREMFTQLLTQPPLPLNKARPGTTFALAVEAVVMKGLAKAPSDRYPNVVAFGDALRDAIGTQQASSGLFGRVKGIFGRK
jgi:serine/threonine-protein kinase